MDVPKRRRTTESSKDDLDGLSERLQSVSLCISAAIDGRGNEHGADSQQHREGMDELRLWYQTEVFAGSDVQQHRWEERRWAFLGQLQYSRRSSVWLIFKHSFRRHVLRKPLNHTVGIARDHLRNLPSLS